METHAPGGYGGIYSKHKHSRLKYKFNFSETIDINYSQAYQDMFVLSMLNGKKSGTYVEIGAGDGILMSNTYLLESQFNWKGISIDMLDHSKASFEETNRKNKLITGNALEINYEALFIENGFDTQIDFLQLDLEQVQTLACLKLIPLNKYRFSVITYETDIYSNFYKSEHALKVKEESRNILLSHGYEMLIGNVCNVGNDPFEDWYVDPNIINSDIINLFKHSPESNITAEAYMLNN